MATEAPNFLERVYHLRTSDFDLHSHILPSSVLDLFQDVAGEHAAKIGIGREDLLPLQRCWMILKTQYRVLRQPALFSDVTVRTWPLESHRVDFGRESCRPAILISDLTNIEPSGISRTALRGFPPLLRPRFPRCFTRPATPT